MTQAVNGARQHAGRATKSAQSASAAGPLQVALQQLTGTLTDRAVSSISGRLGNATDRLTDYAENGGGKGLLSAVTGVDDVTSPVKSAVKKGLSDAGSKVKDTLGGAAGSLFGGKGKGGDKLKVTNIIEHIDVGAPVDLTYQKWTQFAEFPKYMKKVEQVEQISDEKLRWKAQIFLSHRSWESTITEQVPNERIVWRSKGDKGYVDGAITFHELAHNLTRVVVVLEYHPQGLFERTGNLWRAQGRRVRLELKHFQRQLMTDTLLHPDDVDGWQGEIREGEVVEDDSSSNGRQQRSTRKSKGSATSRKTSSTASPRRAGGSTSSRSAARTASGRSTSSRSGSSRRTTTK
ncbi:cyclase [Mycobacteriaceae bacterium 1482268.1]|nr:cyclase [Mycobacteriaceae bacterium 1482268.1]